jgi:RsiW-degrading membrane proteinase PrsW (M82 family)
MILSVLLAVLIPLLFMYLIWSLEVYAFAQGKLLLAALGWGGGAFVIALVFQTTVLRLGILSLNQITLNVAPVVEELLKAGFIAVLAARLRIRYAVDGTIYGFAVGVGFAVGENLLYISQYPDYAFDMTLARLLSSTLMHTFTTALVGTVAGSSLYLGWRARANRAAVVVVGVFVLHAVFNRIATTQAGILLLVLAMGIGIGSTAILIFLIKQNLRAESQTIERELSGQLSDGEVAAVRNPQQIADRLALHQQEIDPRRAGMIQEYVALQAQRAILKKGYVLSRRPRLAQSIDRQLHGIDQRLTALRTAMGLYTWVWLRTVVPSEESAVWEHLDNNLGSEQPILGLVKRLTEREGAVSPAELEERRTLLRDAQLFYDLQDEDLADLTLLLQKQEFMVSEDVIEQGSADEQLYIVAEGSLVVSVVDENGSEIIITVYDRGSCFGELTLFDRQTYPASVTCVSDVTLYTLARDDFMTLLYAKPQVGVEMMRYLTDYIRRETALLVWIQQTGR